MPGFAGAAFSFLKNRGVSQKVIDGGLKFFTSKAGGRLARYASIGAGLGATRGLFDNIIGQDRISVLGGAIQGAVYGGAFMGLAGAWKYGRGMRKASMAARGAVRGAAGLKIGAGKMRTGLPYIQDRILGRGRGVMRRYWGT